MDNEWKQLRLKAEMTQKQWAEELLASTRSVRNWENGIKVPRRVYVAKMRELAQ